MKSPFRIAVVSCIIVFLTILGMRLPFLDKSSKVKPRPRAALNLFAKSASSASASSKNSLTPSFDTPVTSSSTSRTHPGYTLGCFESCQLIPVLSPDMILSKGRSPPLC